jgi:hypothetical protein
MMRQDIRDAFQDLAASGGAAPRALAEHFNAVCCETTNLDVEQDVGARWQWAPAVTDHMGVPLPDDRDFFAAPPQEIGKVLSAWSTLGTQKQPMHAGWRAFWMVVVAGLGAAVGLWLVKVADLWGTAWAVFWPVFLAAAGAAIVWVSSGFGHTCTFVGTEGIAEFTCRGSRGRLWRAKILVFNEATELRTSLVSRYVNGGYQGTNYGFHWTNATGAKRFSFSGTFRNDKGLPKSTNPYHFGLAAQLAWSWSLARDVEQQLRDRGSVLFRMTGDDYVRLGDGWIEFRLNSAKQRWSRAELAEANLNNGCLQLKHRDAQVGWFSTIGVHQIRLCDVANVQLFLTLFPALAAPDRRRG